MRMRSVRSYARRVERREPKEEPLPRYIVERTFRDGLGISASSEWAKKCRADVERNMEEAVTWLHSYVSVDDKTTFCVCEAPSPEAIRKAAARNELPVDSITQVRVLDPYFYA